MLGNSERLERPFQPCSVKPAAGEAETQISYSGNLQAHLFSVVQDLCVQVPL
jgi:hypothetical protein